jgi:hypothetical protein
MCGYIMQGEDLQRLFYFKIGGNIREMSYSDSFFGKLSVATLGRASTATVLLEK